MGKMVDQDQLRLLRDHFGAKNKITNQTGDLSGKIRELALKKSKKGATNIASKIGAKGLGKVASMAAGPLGLLYSGISEAADSEALGPKVGSEDWKMENPEPAKTEQEQYLADIRAKKDERVRKILENQNIARDIEEKDKLDADIQSKYPSEDKPIKKSKQQVLHEIARMKNDRRLAREKKGETPESVAAEKEQYDRDLAERFAKEERQSSGIYDKLLQGYEKATGKK